MKILIASIKGGSGKSTLSINIAAALSSTTSSVLILDTDKQQSSHLWASNRTTEPKIDSKAIQSKLDVILRAESKNYQNVIVDCPQGILEGTLPKVDLMLIPFQMTSFSLSTLPFMLEIVKKNKVPSMAVLANIPTNAGIKNITEYKNYISNYTGNKIFMADTIIYNRKWYVESTSIGQGVTEIVANENSLKNAKTEIYNLLEEIKRHGN